MIVINDFTFKSALFRVLYVFTITENQENIVYDRRTFNNRWHNN